jgi:enoyl-CoA hydratase
MEERKEQFVDVVIAAVAAPLIETADCVRVLTVNRPDKLNALNAEVIAALDAALDAARGDESVGVVTSWDREKPFIAGADIGEFETRRSRGAICAPRSGDRREAREPASRHRRHQHYASGGGLGARVAHDPIARRTRASQPEVKLGILPGYGDRSVSRASWARAPCSSA